jgi:hypothetical protein
MRLGATATPFVGGGRLDSPQLLLSPSSELPQVCRRGALKDAEVLRTFV